MKVCTDSCVFGALLPPLGAVNNRVLDIGCGTGLLALMYAQKYPFVHIDAIEIDHGAYLQALANIKASPWKPTIDVYEGDFKTFTPTDKEFEGYSLIFSNPPFFMGDLRTGDVAKNKALHSSDLTFNELIINAVELLREDGIFCVLLPYSRSLEMKVIAERNRLYPYREVLLRQTASHVPFRTIQFYCKEPVEITVEELIIRMEDQQYSLKFKELLQPYYLYL